MDQSEIQNRFSNANNVYYGHGIGMYDSRKIKSIFENGLRCSHDQLFWTTETLGIGSNTLFEEKLEMLENWKHQNSKQIIIVSVPLKFQHMEIVGTPLYGKKEAAFYDEVSKEKAEKLQIATGIYLRPEFIMGMYDVNQKDFILNERYYENLPGEKQSQLFNKVKRQYIQILMDSGYSFSEYGKILETCNLKNPLTPEEIIEWDKRIREKQLMKQVRTLRLGEVRDVADLTVKDAEKEQEELEFDDWLIE